MPNSRDPEDVEIRYLQEFAPLTNARVLEVGCGAGRLIWRYAESARQVVGFDPNMERLETALQTRAPALRTRVSFAQANAQQLPFPVAAFDGAILAWSL